MPKKMLALKPFTFRGRMLEVEEEFQPDTEDQFALLKLIGLATVKKRGYRNRAMQISNAAVMETDNG